MSSWTTLYAGLFLASFASAALLTFLVVKLAPKVGLVDRPQANKFHSRPTPLGGGLAIFLASSCVLLFEPLRTPLTWTLVSAGAILTAVGLIDDLRRVPATLKFVLLVGLTLVLWQLDIGAHTTRVISIDLLISILWVTGVSSAFNAIDNMDGLATGVTAIAAGTFAIVAVQTGQWVFGGLCLGLGGAAIGFLVFNFPPARVFMGDAGSFYLGFALASLGMVGDWSSNELIAAIIPVLVLGVPVFDLSFTVAIRHFTGVTRTVVDALSHCGTDHVSHRLVRLGLSPRGALAVLYLLSASFGISAVSLHNAASVVGLLHMTQALILTAALVPILLAAPRISQPAAAPESSPDTASRIWLPLGMAATILGSLLVATL